MTTIRIQPDQVRTSGVAAVVSGDDLRAQATALRSASLPPMTAPVAARYQSSLASISARLGSLANAYGSVGEELQVRAAAAEVADAPSASRSASAGAAVAGSVLTTASIVGLGGTTGIARLRMSGASVVASTASGLRLTIPVPGMRPAAAPGAARAAPDPHRAAHSRRAASREVAASTLLRGAPAAIVRRVTYCAPSAAGRSGAIAMSIARGDAIDPTGKLAGEHRAERRDSGGRLVAVDLPAFDESDRGQWACWMASSAPEGVPPVLPVMVALARSGMRNLPAGGDDVGFFGLDADSAYAPPGFGVGRETQPDTRWWELHPEAQLEHVSRRLGDVGGGLRTPDLDDPQALGRWAADAVPGADPEQLADAHGAAAELVGSCRRSHAARIAGQNALSVARGQLGVHELGANAGPEVNRYLASAGVSSGNPWCASFVNWSLQESGHELPGTGWASVSTWVHAAQSGQHGLQIVDPAHARPGDVVAYDWGGQSDFGHDGHIGFLDSHVEGGRFTAVEGNAQDAVTRMDRSLDSGRIMFIRMAA